MKRVYRTKGHLAVGTMLGLAGVLSVVVPAVTSRGPFEAIIGVLIGLAFAGFCTLRLGRAGVVVRDSGIKIVNPLHTITVPWTEVARFTIGQYSLFSPIGFVELVKGSRIHLWGIQGTASLRAAQRIIESLNAELKRARVASIAQKRGSNTVE